MIVKTGSYQSTKPISQEPERKICNPMSYRKASLNSRLFEAWCKRLTPRRYEQALFTVLTCAEWDCRVRVARNGPMLKINAGPRL